MGELTRREFLKLGGLAAIGAGAGALAGCLPEGQGLLKTAESEPRLVISVGDFILEKDGKKFFSLDALAKNYPLLVRQDEEGNKFLANDKKEPVEISFDGMDGEEIYFDGVKTNALLSNVDYESGNESDEIRAGLVLSGNFKLSFSGPFENRPVLKGDGLDRVVVFKNNNEQKAVGTVSNLKFEGLKNYRKNKNGGLDIAPPAYISSDNYSFLFLDKVEIKHNANLPSDVNEENAQLARGVVANNTSSDRIRTVGVFGSAISGLAWDAINGNGHLGIKVVGCQISQDSRYLEKRGAAVSSTFNRVDNSNEGFVIVENSEITYAKGVGIWGKNARVAVKNSWLFCFDWAFLLQKGISGEFEDVVVDIGKEFSLQGDVDYKMKNGVGFPFVIVLSEKTQEIKLKNTVLEMNENLKDSDAPVALMLMQYFVDSGSPLDKNLDGVVVRVGDEEYKLSDSLNQLRKIASQQGLNLTLAAFVFQPKDKKFGIIGIKREDNENKFSDVFYAD